MTRPDSIQEIVFSASQASALTRQLIQEQQGSVLGGVRFGTPAVDKRMIPMLAGELVVLCGRPSNGKTLVQQHMLYRVVQQIITAGTLDEAAILVTWEVSVEQAMAYWFAIMSGISATDMLMGEMTVASWDDLDMAIVQVGSWPLYLIGHSGQRSAAVRRRRPMLTTEAVSAALDYLMNEQRLEPRIIAMDYLQRIHPSQGVTDRNEHYLRAVDWAKDTALQAGCPVVLGSQAARQVDSYTGIKLPRLRDSQWSSNAEQSADKFISLWMPKNSYQLGATLPEVMGLSGLKVTEHLLLMAVVKQRYGPSPLLFPLYVEPQVLKIGDLETRSLP